MQTRGVLMGCALLAGCPSPPVTDWGWEEPPLPESPAECISVTAPADLDVIIVDGVEVVEPVVLEFAIVSRCREAHEVVGAWFFPNHAFEGEELVEVGAFIEPGEIRSIVAEFDPAWRGEHRVGVNLELATPPEDGWRPVRVGAQTRVPVAGPRLVRAATRLYFDQIPLMCWTEPRSISFYNRGEAPARIDGARLTGISAETELLGAFEITGPSEESFPILLPPGGNISIGVRARAQETGWIAASVELDTAFDDHAFGSDSQVRLSAIGGARPRVLTLVDPGAEQDPAALEISLIGRAAPDSIEVRQGGAGGAPRTDWHYDAERHSVWLETFIDLPDTIHVQWRPLDCVD